MIVCFVRHGPAIPSGTRGVAEDSRPLTPDGRRRTRQAALGIKALGLGLDLVATSPLPRALETAEILADELGLAAPKIVDALLPDGTADGVVAAIGKLKAAAPALVGHEPLLSESLARLIGGGTFRFKKAGAAVVQLRGPRLKPDGDLVLFLPPSVLRRLGR